MRYRTLGASGLRVSDLILGAMTFGEQGGVGAPLPECRQMLDLYAEAGGNVIDTAINYRDGASEQILGELLEGRRESFVLGTKYTVSRDRADPNAAGNHRKNLRASLETSLRRLRTDYLDLYWVHMWDRDTPIEETMRTLDDAVQAGKVLYVGISDAPNVLLHLRSCRPQTKPPRTRDLRLSPGNHHRVATNCGTRVSRTGSLWGVPVPGVAVKCRAN